MIETVVAVLLALLIAAAAIAGFIAVTKLFLFLFAKAGVLVISVGSLILLFSLAYLRTFV